MLLLAVWGLVMKLAPQHVCDVLWHFPLFLFVSLGCYAMGYLGMNLLTFRTLPESATASLRDEIEAAKVILAARRAKAGRGVM